MSSLDLGCFLIAARLFNGYIALLGQSWCQGQQPSSQKSVLHCSSSLPVGCCPDSRNLESREQKANFIAICNIFSLQRNCLRGDNKVVFWSLGKTGTLREWIHETLTQHSLTIPKQWFHPSCVMRAHFLCPQTQGQTPGEAGGLRSIASKDAYPLQDPPEHLRTQGVQRPLAAYLKSPSTGFCPQSYVLCVVLHLAACAWAWQRSQEH